jgi:hypothetical protein
MPSNGPQNTNDETVIGRSQNSQTLIPSDLAECTNRLADILESATEEIRTALDIDNVERWDFQGLPFTNVDDTRERLRSEVDRIATTVKELRHSNLTRFIQPWMSFEEFSISDLWWDSKNTPIELILERILSRAEYTEAQSLVRVLSTNADKIQS